MGELPIWWLSLFSHCVTWEVNGFPKSTMKGTVMNKLLTALLIIFAIAVAIVPVHEYRDCYYCHIPVELRANPTLQNHWHDGNKIICDDCWKAGRR